MLSVIITLIMIIIIIVVIIITMMIDKNKQPILIPKKCYSCGYQEEWASKISKLLYKASTTVKSEVESKIWLSNDWNVLN